MLSLGPLFFAAPWLLTALAALPVLWWLMRVTPPAPRRVAFPPVRLLARLRPREETPARTPLWLIILRLLLAALIIVAFAQPLLNPDRALYGSGPLVLAIDDGWASAPGWEARKAVAERLIDQAARDRRPVALLPTARPPTGETPRIVGLMRPDEARTAIGALNPKPWPEDRAAAREALAGFRVDGSAHVAWLTNGLGDDEEIGLARRLQELGSLQIYDGTEAGGARIIRPPQADGTTLAVPVERADAAAPTIIWVRAVADDGRVLMREGARFETGARTALARFDMPTEMRNEIARLQIETQESAGAGFLLDERWRRRPVGLVSGDSTMEAQPLLSDLYYLERALEPFAEIRRGLIGDMLARPLAVLMLADIGQMSESESDRLSRWIEGGGVLVRFAGPRLSQGRRALVPVELRGEGRALGGVMSWSQPAALAPFDEASPFAGLAVPPDVRVNRQVLAEPSVDLAAKTWARLTDGTPLVTAEKRDDGWLILVHTTANSDWSNLSLSGLFVEMMRRIIGLSQGVAGDTTAGTLPPLATLDGFGRLSAPPASARAIAGAEFGETRVGPSHPPGYYGRETARRALNLAGSLPALKPMAALPGGIERLDYARGGEVDLRPWALVAALTLALIDLVIAFLLRGLVPALTARRATAGGAAAALALMVAAQPALAQSSPASSPALPFEEFAVEAASEMRLAYVKTGVPEVDEVSRSGMVGLSSVLRQRTAVEPGEPMGVSPATDELAFFPLLYWPVTARQPPLNDRAVRQLNEYLRTGGTILFDTREQATVTYDPYGQGGAAAQRLRYILGHLDIPPLVPVPADHVLTKSFYLLSDFPGRWTGGTVWIERHGGRHNDGVSSVIIGANDWASAWAADAHGQPRFPVVPGGERQREFAYRFGVNWVMYALTGNYKTDQVHVPAIMRRLGQ